jgi:thymidylate kinase
VTTEAVPALAAAFAALEDSGVPWAVLRGGEESLARGGDVDLLVAPGSGGTVADALHDIGFAMVPSAGEDPHAFFLGRDAATWVALDVVDLLTLGGETLSPELTRQVLGRRVLVGDRWHLDPDDEFWYLILHHASRPPGPLRGLEDHGRRAAATGPLAALVARRAGDDGDLLDDARRDPGIVVETLRRSGATRPYHVAVRRRVGSWAPRRVAPRVVHGLHELRRPSGLSVAIIGPDGAGKTTLADGLRRALPMPTRYVYLGVWREYPWDRWLRRIAGTRLMMRLLRLSLRSLQVWWHRCRGRVVLIDRYTYDALLPSDILDRRGRLTVALVRRLGVQPDLVIVLDAPAEVMYARKGEHGVEELERRRQTYLEVTRAHPHCVVLDAAQPASAVLAQSQSVIWSALQRRWQSPT